MKRWVVLFSAFFLGCAPDTTEKIEKKGVDIFFPR
jgi:hypothetical protein